MFDQATSASLAWTIAQLLQVIWDASVWSWLVADLCGSRPGWSIRRNRGAPYRRRKEFSSIPVSPTIFFSLLSVSQDPCGRLHHLLLFPINCFLELQTWPLSWPLYMTQPGDFYVNSILLLIFLWQDGDGVSVWSVFSISSKECMSP